jgi:sialate O-acetylesterase
MKIFKLLSPFLLCFIFPSAKADITLPNVFSSNMVLQRGMEIPVWGWADPGERVTVTLGEIKNQSKQTARGCGRLSWNHGSWRAL